MRLPSRQTPTRLQSSLAAILRGISLEEWAENTSLDLLRITEQKSPPLELLGPILESRKTKLVYKTNLPVRAKLETETDGFVVELGYPPKHKFKFLWWRLSLAHEIAHTFLYDLRESPPVQLVRFRTDNLDLEWLCHYLAKRFLIPAVWLRQQSENLPDVNSDEFSLTIFKKLERIFSVPWKVVAERLIEDLSLWNCIMLQFTQSDEVNFSSQKLSGNSLCLSWHTIPRKVKEKVYIPIGRRIKGRMKFPRVNNPLSKFLSECLKKGQYQPHFKCAIPLRVLNCDTTGNLGKFLFNHLSTNNIQVYCAVKLPEQKELLNLRTTNQKLPSVVMCIPL